MADASAKTRTCMDDGGIMAALPEDVLLEIFSRVGSVKDLFRFAVTCRNWLRRFTDPAFLRALCPSHGEGHRARLLGFFFQQTKFVRCERMLSTRKSTPHTSVCAPTFLPAAAKGSPLGTTDRALTSFIPDDDGDFNYAVPMASRRGIVLMELVPRTVRTIDNTHLLGICNPITGQRHVLPPLPRSGVSYHLIGYAIITVSDIADLDGGGKPSSSSSSSGRFTFSRLLLTTRARNSDKVYLHTYSVATRSWSAPTLCVDDRRFSLVGERSAVVHRGVAHWLYSDIDSACIQTRDDNLYKLSVDARRSRLSLTKLPFCAGGSPFLGITSEGKLSVACMFPVHVRVWTQQDDEDDTPATWLRDVIRIPMVMSHPTNYQQFFQKWFDFNMGSMLMMYKSNGIGVFILDLEKKVMEKVMDCFLDLSSDKLDRIQTPVAYEMDLVEFFVLQLGGLHRDLQDI